MDENKETTEKVIDEVVDMAEVDAVEPKETTGPSLPEEKNNNSPVETPPPSPKKTNWFKRFLRTKKGKAAAIAGAIILVVALLLAVPMTRYGILGTFMKKSVHVMVMDSSTMKPVSQATVTLGDKTTKTGNNGEVVIDSIPVGEYTLKVTKGYYKANELSYTVPVLGDAKQAHVSLMATGRQVVLSVSNKITKAMLAGATVTVQGTSAVTDDKGKATIVLPADKKTLQAVVNLDGYNQATVEVKVTDQADANVVSLTPAGNIYYLSKQTGKINVMKSHLDGSDASVVVEGTGNENDRETVLLAARDWNYMALSSKRDGTKTERLYLVEAKTGKLTTIDEGADINFQLVGWSDHHFVYVVNRDNKNIWDDKRQALKSYDAESGKLTTLDEPSGMGTNWGDHQSETIQTPYILEGKVSYAKVWSIGDFVTSPSDKKSAIMAINPDGSGKQRVKDFAMQHTISVEGKLYEPQEIYFRVSVDNAATPTYYAYEPNTVKAVSSTDDKFYNTFYPTYLVSPTGQKTLWYEPRDGKNTLIVGDKDGKAGTTLASQSEYTAYGWYGDKYVLLSKNGSELYIAQAEKALDQPFKITNYHKPNVSFPGYGYGYGGNG